MKNKQWRSFMRVASYITLRSLLLRDGNEVKEARP
jgi:hypothetical protein